MAWARLDVTVAKQPVLYDSERILYTVGHVGLYKGDVKTRNYSKGYAYLTSQRICYVDDSQPEEHSIYATLKQIRSSEYSGAFIKSSPKITLDFMDAEVDSREYLNPWICPICSFSNNFSKSYVRGQSEAPICENCGVQAPGEVIEAALSTDARSIAVSVQPPTTAEEEYIECPVCTFHNHPYLRVCEVCGTGLSARSTAVDLGSVVKLSFRAGGARDFFVLLQPAVAKSKIATGGGEVLHDGSEMGHRSGRGSPTRSSRGDEGSEVVHVAEEVAAFKFGIHSIEQASSKRQLEGNSALDAALTDVRAIETQAAELTKLIEAYGRTHPEAVQTLGLESALVSKDMVSGERTFRQQIARQVTEFMDKHKILATEGGVISLFDVYSLYNRARGTELVSPDDVAAAMSMAEDLNLPIRVRELRSGVKVVETKLYKSTQQRLADWIATLTPWQAAAGVSALETSSHFHWSLMISLEELEMAEDSGLLCRDEQPSGIRFFENRFLKTAAGSATL